MYVIIILMFLPFAEPTGPNAVVVTHSQGEALEFTTIGECYAHISANLKALHLFADRAYPGIAVKSIECMKKQLSI